MRVEAANEAVLEVLEENVRHPDVTDTVVQKVVEKLRASQEQKKHNRQQYMRGSAKLMSNCTDWFLQFF